MKRIFAGILCLALSFVFVACGKTTAPEETTTTTAAPTTTAPVITDELQAQLDEIVATNKWKGIVSLAHNGQVVYEFSAGVNDLGEPLTVDSPMYIGSVSKQFCATAILMLRDQGKLSVDDTLDKYFPEYQLGKDITVKHLLTMRSGIPNFTNHLKELTLGSSGEGWITDLNTWIFNKKLNFQPDKGYEYCNTNYFLLGQIVEMVSGQDYEVFIRQNILVPLGMNQTGFVLEVQDQPAWAAGLNYNSFPFEAGDPEIVKGTGDLTSTAADIHKWMAALPTGKVISRASYEEMIANYSADFATRYGYGISGMAAGGYGHTGNIGSYVALDYFNEPTGYTLFMASSEQNPKLEALAKAIVNALP